ncbi:MAG: hypothetical protein K9N10_06630 [Deltaproteobacteria bacterium]|nr:hypothetical protein [Deltaproteobacteria bacterium]
MRILIARIYIVNVFRIEGRLTADGETALGDKDGDSKSCTVIIRGEHHENQLASCFAFDQGLDRSLGEILHYEALGLCEPGEGGRLAASVDTALCGRIPLNVSGSLPSPGKKTPGHPIRSHKNVATLRRLQQEFNFHGFVWKNDAPFVVAIKDAGV